MMTRTTHDARRRAGYDAFALEDDFKRYCQDAGVARPATLADLVAKVRRGAYNDGYEIGYRIGHADGNVAACDRIAEIAAAPPAPSGVERQPAGEETDARPSPANIVRRLWEWVKP